MYICLSFLYSHLKISDLIVHLQSVHDYPVEVEQLHFPAITEFLSWKADEEKKMHSAYVHECAPRTFDTTKHRYYYCNRKPSCLLERALRAALRAASVM